MSDSKLENFHVELTDFTWTTKGSKTGRQLRCTLTWKAKTPFGIFIDTTEGWRFGRSTNGEIVAMPPLNQYGNKYYQNHRISPDWAAYLVQLIRESKYGPEIGNELLESMVRRPAWEANPELPEKVTNEEVTVEEAKG